MQPAGRPSRPTLRYRTGPRGRRPIISWSGLLLGFLLLAFLSAMAYASVQVYAWARDAARALPDVAGVSLPEVIIPAVPKFSRQFDGPILSAPMVPRAAAGVELPPQQTQTRSKERVTVLLLGTDQRPDDPSPPRTDNVMVLTVELATGKAGLISLPRDLLVSVPGFGLRGKLNTAYVIGESNDYPGGGGALAKKTVSEFLGYPIDYYVKINFDGFEKAVDLIGGIDIDVPKTIHDEKYPTIDYGYSTFHIDAGPQHLDGATALKYVRTRNIDSDFERSWRQQQVLMAIKDKLVENKLFATLRILDIINIMADSVEHDIPPSDLLDLVALAGQMEIGGIQQLVLDTRYGLVDPDSPYGWVLVPDGKKIQPAVDQFFVNAEAEPRVDVDAEAVARQQAQQQAELARQFVQNSYLAQAEALRQQLATEGARIMLYNGTGDPTLAPRAADWLRRQGYDIVDFDQADRTDYPRTVLLCHSDKPFTVSTLQDAFAIADSNVRQSTNLGSDVDLRLIIGQDFYLLVSN